MRIGTRSLLYGAHAFWLHPWFVAWAWHRLYGARQLRDPRLWLAFMVHDWGYWGKPNMDGPEGESHPELGAHIMYRIGGPRWSTFTGFHSRYYANKCGAPPSPLCYADKMALILMPAWLYVPLARASEEIREYRQRALDGKYGGYPPTMHASDYEWFEWAKCLTVKYLEEVRTGNNIDPGPALPVRRVQ